MFLNLIRLITEDLLYFLLQLHKLFFFFFIYFWSFVFLNLNILK